MTASATESRVARLVDRWRARSTHHSRGVWVLLMILDILPWPWGEDIVAGLFMIGGLALPRRRRAALAWAEACRAPHRWRLAAKICAFLGRWVARSRTLGVRTPAELRRHLVIEGEEHLALPGAAILLGFHLGPPGNDLTCPVLGYPVTFFGWSDRAASMGWWSQAWRPFVEPTPLSFASRDDDRWTAVLYTARQRLLAGQKIYILADGKGKASFSLPLSVGEWSMRRGWITLHQLTGAPVLPVLHRLDGRRHVMTIHPPLPALEPDSPRPFEAWQHTLTGLVEDYVRRCPEQCPLPALIRPVTRLRGTPSAMPSPDPARRSS